MTTGELLKKKVENMKDQPSNYELIELAKESIEETDEKRFMSYEATTLNVMKDKLEDLLEGMEAKTNG